MGQETGETEKLISASITLSGHHQNEFALKSRKLKRHVGILAYYFMTYF